MYVSRFSWGSELYRLIGLRDEKVVKHQGCRSIPSSPPPPRVPPSPSSPGTPVLDEERQLNPLDLTSALNKLTTTWPQSLPTDIRTMDMDRDIISSMCTRTHNYPQWKKATGSSHPDIPTRYTTSETQCNQLGTVVSPHTSLINGRIQRGS